MSDAQVPILQYEPGLLTQQNLAELQDALVRASTRVPLATAAITVVRPYVSRSLAGEYQWHDRELPKIDIGIPGLGQDGSILEEHPPVFRDLKHVYFPAGNHHRNRGILSKMTQFLRHQSADDSREMQPLFLGGVNNLEARLTHELAHGQVYEAQFFIPKFRERMHAAVSEAIGVPTIDFKVPSRATSRAEVKAQILNDAQHQRIREAVASELGLYAATLPLFANQWNELWPEAVTSLELSNQPPGPIASALIPFREEFAAIDQSVKDRYLHDRLDARGMPIGDLRALEENRFDLFAIAQLRSGNLDKAGIQALKIEA